MKKLKNTKYFIMFLSGILFSAFTVFATTVNVNTNFTQNAVQYLQQMVLTDTNGTTGVDLNGTGDSYLLNELAIGKSSASFPLDVSGVVYATYFSGDGSNLTNLPVTGGLWSTGSSSINYILGNVGIGLTGPNYALEVSGVAYATYFSGDGSNLTNLSVTGGLWSTGSSSSINYILGNVGIGLTGPNYALEVSGTIKSNYFSGQVFSGRNLYIDNAIFASSADADFDDVSATSFNATADMGATNGIFDNLLVATSISASNATVTFSGVTANLFSGTIVIPNTSTTNTGTIKFSGDHFYGYIGTTTGWLQLDN